MKRNINKHMKINTALLILSLAFTFNSCETDTPFHIKDNTPKLILNALIDANLEENYIYLAQTGKENIDSILNATVNIYINEELKDQITQNYVEYSYDPDSITINYRILTPKAYKTNLHFSPGDRVRIEAYANDGKYHAWAEDIIPTPIGIEQIDTSTYEKYTFSHNDSYIRLKTTFTDIPDENNFYRITLVQTETVHGKTVHGKDTLKISKYQTLMDTREDIILNDGKVILDDNFYIPQIKNSYCVFDDIRLNGTYTMTTSFYRSSVFYFDPYYNPIGFNPEYVANKYDIHLISITETYYYYLKALNIISSDNYDEYLSMPVSFPSNVEGGIGFVGFSAGTSQTFSIPDIIPDTIGYQNYNPRY